MSWHSVSSFNSFHCHPERPVEEPRSATSLYSSQHYHGHDRDCSDSRHASKQQPRYSSIYDSPVTMDKISLPAVFSGPLSQPSPSSSTPTIPTTRSAPRTLQPDLYSSSFGVFFGVQSPPSSIKRPLTDMAASQVRNRDIDSRHQDHQQHQASQPSYPEPTPPLTGIKLQLQIMPSDHPPVDPTGIVYGSQQRERLQQI
ncbi:hypothetical protein MVEG_11399 [Podila verticillata NRRL 6337]|uniref:Uncharacterized protein n=1 Tax=Podila verticillata NRRL 6337 TaxID=1069443 RepID=A0A086TLP8_9FUNG|nr:hypothetical protein MVEG_11399 [Podila verticillata NRRL 6337]